MIYIYKQLWSYTVNSLIFARDSFADFHDHIKIAKIKTRKHNSGSSIINSTWAKPQILISANMVLFQKHKDRSPANINEFTVLCTVAWSVTIFKGNYSIRKLLQKSLKFNYFFKGRHWSCDMFSNNYM